jgi:hypothetical protein
MQTSLAGSPPRLAFAQTKSDRDNRNGEHNDDADREQARRNGQQDSRGTPDRESDGRRQQCGRSINSRAVNGDHGGHPLSKGAVQARSRRELAIAPPIQPPGQRRQHQERARQCEHEQIGADAGQAAQMDSQLFLVLERPQLLVARLHQQRHQSPHLQDLLEHMGFLACGQVANRPVRDGAGASKPGNVRRIVHMYYLDSQDAGQPCAGWNRSMTVTNFSNQAPQAAKPRRCRRRADEFSAIALRQERADSRGSPMNLPVHTEPRATGLSRQTESVGKILQ